METPSVPRAPAWLALAAMVLSTATALVAALWWRLPSAAWPQGWPWPALAPPPEPAVSGVATAAVVVAVAAWSSHRDPAWRRSLLVGLAWPALPLAAAWLLAPAAGPPSVAALAAAAATLTAAVWLRRRVRAAIAPREGRRPGLPRAGWLALHAVAVAALTALGLWGGGFGDPRALVLSLLLYPLYALVQLFLVLAVLWPHLDRLSAGREAPAVTAAALIFALAHWPNPALMLLTGAGMSFWAVAYGRGRGLMVLALSMGLLATLAAQGLPDRWTDHMRAGPRCVRARAVPSLAAQAARQAADRPAGRARTTAFLAALYPGIVGREASPEELQRWWLSISACRRGVLAWRIYISDEYRRKIGEPAGEAPPAGDLHWTRLPAPWPARIDAHTRDAPGDPPPAWEDFLARLYREILRREATSAELAAWPRDLSARQRERLVSVLLEKRRQLAAAPFDTCTCRRLQLHH